MASASPADRDEPAAVQAAIFDLDGVLTDTAEYHYRGWQQLADEQGWAFDRELNERLRGVSRMESLAIILDHNGVEASAQQQQEWADRKNRYYVDALADVGPEDLLPGARELVAACKQRGLRVAIASSSRNARMVLDRLEIAGEFDAISDGHSVELAKPSPDLFLHAAEQLDAGPARCVVFEDAGSGVDAALAAGMVAVGIGPPERVGHAHHRFDTVADVHVDAVLASRSPGA